MEKDSYVLSSHLLKYFCFPKCLKILALVCKRFDHVIQHSTVSKQIRINPENSQHTLLAPRVLSKYNVDVIILKSTGTSISTFATILKSSKRLNTLVIQTIPDNNLGYLFFGFEDQSTRRDIPNYLKFDNITTLSVPSVSHSILHLFPNVKQLKLVHIDDGDKEGEFSSVKELEFQPTRTDDLERIIEVFPSVQVVHALVTDTTDDDADEIIQALEEFGKDNGIQVNIWSKHLVLEADQDLELGPLQYHQYFNGHGVSPLAHEIITNYRVNVKLLDLTNPTYERDLKSRDPVFRFPLLSLEFGAEVSDHSYGDIDDLEVFKFAAEHGFADFWDLLKCLPEDATNKFFEMDVILPANSELIPQLLADLFTHIPIPDIISKFGKERLQQLFQVRDTSVTVFGASYETFDIDLIADLIDWKAVLESNLATKALWDGNPQKWLYFLKRGLKYEEDVALSCIFENYFFRQNSKEILETLRAKGIPSLMNELPFDPTIDLIDMLVEAGEDVNACDKKGVSFFNSLLELEYQDKNSQYNTLKHLLNKYNVDINHVDESGNTPLTTTLTIGSPTEVDFLLMHGADPNLAVGTMCPLFLAISCEEPTAIPLVNSLLYCGADINKVDYDKFGRKITPLALAVIASHYVSVLEYLVARGAKLDFIDENGNNLLHLTLLGNDVETIVQTIKYLSKHCDINRQNDSGRTPLHIAFRDNFVEEICKTLIECGADVNLARADGQVPFTLAIRGNSKMIRHLIKRDDIDFKVRDVKGFTCFSYLNYNTAVELAKDFTDETFLADLKKWATPENIEFMINEFRKYFSNPKNNTFTDLFEFFTYNLMFAKYFIEVIGIDVNITDYEHDTMIYWVNFGFGRSEEVFEYLVAKGANINQLDSLGSTPILAAFDNVPSPETAGRIRTLLKLGADPSIKNNTGYSAADLEPNWKYLYAGSLKIAGTDLLELDLAELRKTGKIKPKPETVEAPLGTCTNDRG